MGKKLEYLRQNIFSIMLITAVVARYFTPELQQNPRFSFSYLDPGTGTMIISAIVGIFATIILGVKTFWFKIASFFKSKKKN